MLKRTKTQTIIIYAALIAFVVAALLAMSTYIQRSIQGTYKAAGDGWGDEEF